MSEEKKTKKLIYLNLAILDESLYLAILNKKLEKRKQGVKITIRELVEKYVREGISNDK